MPRIFVAFPLSQQLQEIILNWRKTYDDFPVRWLEGKNLHITLIPPWEEENPATIIEKLQSLKHKFGAFQVAFTETGFGSDPAKPRLIWATGPTPQELLYIKADSERLLDKQPARETFLTHTTLARFKPHDFKNFPTANLAKHISWSEQINSLVLMQSHRLPDGADYEILTEISL
jgi:RNA 2',3'-cyclic 3'-phosphodiesterase